MDGRKNINMLLFHPLQRPAGELDREEVNVNIWVGKAWEENES